MTYKEMRQLSGMTQQKFADFFCIPKRTVQNWDLEQSPCKQYLIDLLAYRLQHDKEALFERVYFHIKDLRVATGMTQKEYSEYFGLTLGTLKNWESCKHCLDYLVALMEYKLTVEKIIK